MNNRIDEKIQKGYELELGQIIDNSFEIFKKIVWTAGLGYFLVTIFMLSLIVLGMTFLDPSQLDYIKEISQDPAFLENNPDIMGYYLVFIIVVGSIFVPLNAGFLNLCHLAKTNQQFSILNIFDYYKSKHVKDLIIGTLILTIFSTIITTLLDFANLKLVGFVIQMSISLFTILFIPLIIYGNQNFSNAIQKSIKLVVKYPFTILGALVIGIVFAMLGMIAFCIGILFTLPYINCIYYSLYESIVGFEEEKIMIEKIEDSEEI
jgi:uncharacterized membrane protein